MRVLFVMDPVERLDKVWDTSLCLLREFAHRGHQNWTCDATDLWAESNRLFARARKVIPVFHSQKVDFLKVAWTYRLPAPQKCRVENFDLVLIRKDPPFDDTYLYLTYLLELIAETVPVVNHPRGIRNANEKLSTLLFPKWIPESLVSNSPDRILEFQKKLGTDLVVKPLDEKGGKGVFRLRRGSARNGSHLRRVAGPEKKFLIASRYLAGGKNGSDKRILILEGKFLSAFERRPRPGEFRSNLSLGGTFHPTKLTLKEKRLIADLKPFLLRESLQFAGIDVRDEKLIEINVTSPAGIWEAEVLYPRLRPAAKWAQALEHFAGHSPSKKARFP